jgi:hypothetical protein
VLVVDDVGVAEADGAAAAAAAAAEESGWLAGSGMLYLTEQYASRDASSDAQSCLLYTNTSAIATVAPPPASLNVDGKAPKPVDVTTCPGLNIENITSPNRCPACAGGAT